MALIAQLGPSLVAQWLERPNTNWKEWVWYPGGAVLCFFLSDPATSLQAWLQFNVGPISKLFMYRIQTDARVITGNTTEIKNRGRRPRFFISRLYFP